MISAPLLLPISPDNSAYEGYISPTISAGGLEPATLWLRLTGLPRAGATLRGTRLEVSCQLASLLEGYHEIVGARLAESPSLAAFLVELRSLLDQACLQRSAATAKCPSAGPVGLLPSSSCSSRPAAFYTLLRDELASVGWERVSSLATDLSALTLRLQDQRGRSHELRLSLPAGYPAAAPAATADLPLPFEPRWGSGAGLPQLVAQFEAALALHQELWSHLDDLDAHARVIEPAHPPRSAVFRRLALGSNVSLGLTLDPARPSALPACQFMGPDAALAPLRQRLHQHGSRRWREDALLRHNLEAVLEILLPTREDASTEDISAACAICYAFCLPPPEGQEGEGEAPDVCCENPQCGKPFHRSPCLVEWLNADTSTRQSFNTLFGSCPYCSAPITVKISG